ncbi:MAG TPA: TIGR03067 domain-containing protein [Gemmataceae bacterium]|nr:TIGR03067 domain-containing protein [Gemmataceae bacterium]
MRRFTCFAAAVLGSAILAMTSQAAVGKTDKELLQGTWTVTSFTVQGKEVGNPGKVKEFLIIFKGDNVSKKGDGQEDGPFAFTLDSTKNPKEIDMAGVPEATKGIYELKDDVLRIGMGEKGRPKSFTDAEMIITLKKMKG